MQYDTFSVFIDESGDPNIPDGTDGRTNHYVACAVIIRSSLVEEVRKLVGEIAKEYVNGAPIKSKSVGNVSRNRTRILEAISQLGICFACSSLDKSSLKSKGFQYRKTMYKFLQSQLIQRVEQIGPINAYTFDTYGGEDFASEVKRYMQEKQNLFSDPDIIYKEAQLDRCLQLADLIGGTIRRILERIEPDKQARHYLKIINDKNIGIRSFPYNRLTVGTGVSTANTNHDDDITQYMAYTLARVEEKFSLRDDAYDRMRLFILRHLDWQQAIGQQSVTGTELISLLAQNGMKLEGLREFGTQVIGPLRDEGVLIAGTSSGYSLAMNVDELQHYINHNDVIISNMLRKLSKAREQLKSSISYDCLAGARYGLLGELTDCFKNSRYISSSQQDEDAVDD